MERRGGTGRAKSKKSKRRTAKTRVVIFAAVSLTLATGAGVAGYALGLRQARQEATQHNTHKPESTVDSGKRQAPPESPKTETPLPKEPEKSTHDTEIPPVKNGLAPVISKLPTEQPVVFLTIDDGIHKDPAQLELMKQHKVTASLYLTYNFIRGNPDFFKGFTALGMPIQNHTISHTYLSKRSYEAQKQEICGNADKMEQLYGERPIFLRPPGGYYNDETRRAAAECGMKAVVMWSAKANGGSMQYQVGDGLRPGDIVLMHFRPEFKQDLESFVAATKAAGLRTELLEDWMPAQAQ